jgi:Spy/CpxP family protein refolding chaperone
MTNMPSAFRSGTARISYRGLSRVVCLLAAVCALTLSAWAQNQSDPNQRNRGNRGDPNQGGGRGNFNPQEMQGRMLSALRERLGVTNDDEWNVIQERVMKLFELRRNDMGGGRGGGFLFGGRGGDQGGRPPAGRGGSSNPDIEALQSAVTGNAPDGEIKARLERLRLSRKENTAKIEQAQEELKAVLTVRQEAIMVMAGLLP